MGVPDKPSHRTHTDPGSAGLADTGQPPVECRVLRRCVQSRSQWSPPPSILHPRDSIRNIQEPPHVTPDTGQSPKSPLYLLQKSILLSPCITAPSSLWSFLRPLSLNKQQHLISVSEERLSPIVLYSTI